MRSTRRQPRSDAELLARTRVLLSAVLLYLLSMTFLETMSDLYAHSPHLSVARLATLPFFFLVARVWLRLVRVRPPALLLEARRLTTLGRHRAAREKLDKVESASPGARRLDRARRLLQGPMAVPLALELDLERGRASLALGELDRAVDELGQVQARLPLRAEVAIDLAEALFRSDQPDRAAAILRGAATHMDRVDIETLKENKALLDLVGGPSALPRRSSFHGRLQAERVVLGGVAALALVHALHFYLGLF